MVTKEDVIEEFKGIQAAIIAAAEGCDDLRFTAHSWQRPAEAGLKYGGGGTSCLLQQGSTFEQAGINFSAVEGKMSAALSEKLVGSHTELPFFATGVSLVIHPLSPRIPTTHANIRYLEVGNYRWFGGGADLTPYTLVENDAQHFHVTMKKWCDSSSPDYYPKFKKWCDEYFFLPHRGETRGVGGIFFDYLGRENQGMLSEHFEFARRMGEAFIEAYFPLVKEHGAESYSNADRQFQLWRRGRYVEFNLLYDKGTKFGLETGGRTQSILMSLPPLVRWDEEFYPSDDSPEGQLLAVLREPREWV